MHPDKIQKRVNRAIEIIKSEQKYRKKERERIRTYIQHGFAPALPSDVSAHIASFVSIKLPISDTANNEIDSVFRDGGQL
jgi:hypothetical protein